MSFIVKGNNYKYTVATPRYITNTYVIPEGIQPALYKLTEQDIPLTYVTRKTHNASTRKPEERMHPVLYSNPESQAPWMTLGEEDPYLIKKEGQIRRGPVTVDLNPEAFTNQPAPLAVVLDDTVIENPASLGFPLPSELGFLSKLGLLSRLTYEAEPYVLRDNTYVGEEAFLNGGVSTKGKVTIGNAYIEASSLKGGNIKVGGGAYVTMSRIKGNVTINGVILEKSTLDGNINFTVPGKTFDYQSGKRPDMDKEPVIEGTRYVSDFINHKKSQTFFQPETVEALLAVSREIVDSNQRQATFCLDSVNHRSFCRCALYLPLYIMARPAAIQYNAIMGGESSVHKLPAGHPYEFMTANSLEPMLDAEIMSNYSSGAIAKATPTDATAWRKVVKKVTGIKPVRA